MSIDGYSPTPCFWGGGHTLESDPVLALGWRILRVPHTEVWVVGQNKRRGCASMRISKALDGHIFLDVAVYRATPKEVHDCIVKGEGMDLLDPLYKALGLTPGQGLKVIELIEAERKLCLEDAVW